MTNDEIIGLVTALRGKGACRIKVGDVEVEFEKRDDSNFDPIQMMEKAAEDAKAQLIKHMSPEEQEKLEKKLEEDLKYGSS